MSACRPPCRRSTLITSRAQGRRGSGAPGTGEDARESRTLRWLSAPTASGTEGPGCRSGRARGSAAWTSVRAFVGVHGFEIHDVPGSRGILGDAIAAVHGRRGCARVALPQEWPLDERNHLRGGVALSSAGQRRNTDCRPRVISVIMFVSLQLINCSRQRTPRTACGRSV